MQKLKIGRIVLGSCQTNCYFVYREGEKQAIVFDPADQGSHLYEKLTENGFRIVGILLTHGHFDHILGCAGLKELSGAKIYAYEKEKVLCEDPFVNVSAQTGRSCTVEVDEYVKDGQEITLADMTCKVLATPGHTVGSCCYYFEEDKLLISGDTLFLESVGRTDLPTGSMTKLTNSIKEKIAVLPEDVQVYPGHGDSTTVGHELQYNPFLG